MLAQLNNNYIHYVWIISVYFGFVGNKLLYGKVTCIKRGHLWEKEKVQVLTSLLMLISEVYLIQLNMIQFLSDL